MAFVNMAVLNSTLDLHFSFLVRSFTDFGPPQLLILDPVVYPTFHPCHFTAHWLAHPFLTPGIILPGVCQIASIRHQYLPKANTCCVSWDTLIGPQYSLFERHEHIILSGVFPPKSSAAHMLISICDLGRLPMGYCFN
jgi:hypothetical protein